MSNKPLTYPIFHLENSDIHNDKIIQPKLLGNKYNILYLQANFCGYCQVAKQPFQDFANLNENNFNFLTVVCDSEKPNESDVGNMTKHIKNFKGFPHYCVFGRNGEHLIEFGEPKGRDTKSLEAWVENLK